MKIFESKKYLITNHHIIFPNRKNNDTEIEIWNKKRMKLNLNNRDVRYYPYPKDITIVEIKITDELYEDIRTLNYDSNCINGYDIYKNNEIFSIQNPLKENSSCEIGKIININNFEFKHNIPIDKESSGCPIILLNNKKNLVIGIHKEGITTKNLNYGTFIGEIFKENNISNYIIAEIEIKDDDINKEIRIINSYEEQMRTWNENRKSDFMNEEEIKKCEIRVGDKIIPFKYFYKFNNKGIYNIKYSFKNYLTKANYMFSSCESLIKIDLSNFNTLNINNMIGMFRECKSLTNIDLSNFNTQNVTNMSEMFYRCEALTNIDLSNFTTENVTNMRSLFSYCESLTSLDLSSFNTQNVANMWCIFSECKSLTDINLSSFDTQNVTNMWGMFSHCNSLTNIDLSNFNTQNVTNMSQMFSDFESLININLSNFNTQKVTKMSKMFLNCKSLKNLDLSNFNSQNVSEINKMFNGCQSLKRENIITSDNNIISEYWKK